MNELTKTQEETTAIMPDQEIDEGPEEHSTEMYFGEPETLESLGYSFETGV